MIKLILTTLIVFGSGIFWVWRRYFSVPAQIKRKQAELARLMKEQQDALENRDMVLFNHLDTKRLELCEQIHRLRR